jgi:Leucine-rich repeat (LRR) protein
MTYGEIEEMKIENLSSLKTIDCKFTSVKRISFKNLFALTELNIKLERPVNSEIVEMITNNSPNIELLTLNGSLSNFNLDKLIHLKKLTLYDNLMEDFNYDIFKHICNQLTALTVGCRNISYRMLIKMFNGLNFSNLSQFSISSGNIIKLDKKLFDKCPMLGGLSISMSRYLRIDGETFSSLKQLTGLTMWCNNIDSLENKYFSELNNLKYLSLYGNNIKVIRENTFSNLKKLHSLDLSLNMLKNLSSQVFFGLINLKYLSLRGNKLRNFDLSISDNFDEIQIDISKNPINNKNEILNRFKDSKIQIIL